ncbi:hypothetical protein B0H65DRAFT_79809 [Neurospora tetraspora]|uniref:Amidohydrolase-related domain-containing protein n=1 Tax=Neurospora tetraspora TaxID=94610 RepID=A0AAE0MJU3_9PEZI|nr:hypothetical protein B0H65DRAFT_79809 [Neurospora tetraspora]
MLLRTASRPLCLLALAGDAIAGVHSKPSAQIAKIIKQAKKDVIDLEALPFAQAAFRSIEEIKEAAKNQTRYDFRNASRIDVHVHAVPSFYHDLVPLTGGSPTPEWSVQEHLQFMADDDITRAIISMSTPGATVFYGNEAYSVGLARLLNEWLAELKRSFPNRFDFFAVMPLPYNNAALKEAQYALSSLGALGLGLLTNHEGYYLGNAALAPFFEALNNTIPGGPHVCIVHPTEPLMRVDNGSSIIVANPTTYPTGRVEFYFETARALMDLVLSQTLIKYTNVRWSIAHVGGAFPAIEDRFLKRSGALEKLAKQALNSRVWYDSAGPTYFAQVKGLLGYGVPTSQLVFGSDFPYSHFPYEAAAKAIVDADFLTQLEKTALFETNVEDMFGVHFHGHKH